MKFQTIFAFAVCVTLAVLAGQARATPEENVMQEMVNDIESMIPVDCFNKMKTNIEGALKATVEELKGQHILSALFNGVKQFIGHMITATDECGHEVNDALVIVGKKYWNKLF